MDAWDWVLLIFLLTLGALGGLMWGFPAGVDVAMRKLHSEATLRGYGEYCAGDGRFAWVGECGE